MIFDLYMILCVSMIYPIFDFLYHQISNIYLFVLNIIFIWNSLSENISSKIIINNYFFYFSHTSNLF